jgi:hypothetical protein
LFRSGGRIEALTANQLCVTENLMANVRFGSKADMNRLNRDVCFTPNSGH